MSKKPKILLLTCGGTIGMASTPEGFLAPSLTGQEILDKIPEVQAFADVDIVEIMNIDSTNLQPHHWTTITKEISQRYNDYDGFVITQGTDTLAYTSSALSFSIQNLSKPVVITGAMKPFEKVPSDATNNLINAIKVATMDIAEVCVVFGTRIIRGCRATKKGEISLDAFHSRIISPLGKIGIEPYLIDHVMRRSEDNTAVFLPNFSANILYLKIIPGMKPDYILNDIERCDGIIFESTASGNVPSGENSLIPVIEKANALEKPVVITTHGQKSGLLINNYEPSFLAMKAGAIPAKDMSAEAATTKLMWALANSNTYSEIREIITSNIAGEILS